MKSHPWLLALAACAPAADPAPPAAEAVSAEATPWFVDRAVELGLVFAHDSGHRDRFLMPEIMGGGAALFDMDADGDLDAYLVQSGYLDGAGAAPFANALFEGDGTGRFTDVSGTSGADDDGYGMGVACGDVDLDGDVDLYVTNLGPNVLLLNDGTGRFVDGTEAAGVGDPRWSTSAAFVDLEHDGDLDLYVCNYLEWQATNELPCRNRMGQPDYCSPLNYDSPARDSVFENAGSGTFTDLSEAFGTPGHRATGLGVVCEDFDGDGAVEVFVANDGMPNLLWVRGENGWNELAGERGCALDNDGVAKAGMGVDAADVDGDGDADLLVCNLREEADSFYRNDGNSFRDRTVAIGLGAVSRPMTRFGVGWADFDNDGALDLYQANGRVMRQSHTFAADPYAEPNLVLRGSAGGRFEPAGDHDHRPGNSRAAAFGDVNGDGGVDVLVVNVDGPAQLFLNTASDRGAWIAFRLRDPGRSALHARVAFEADRGPVVRTARAAASYQASRDPRVHVGLGPGRTAAGVRVTWTDGTQEVFGDRAAGEVHVLTRGQGRTP